jgi:hypothetical protein
MLPDTWIKSARSNGNGGNNCVEVRWKASTRSGNTSCVEVRRTEGTDHADKRVDEVAPVEPVR